MSFIRKLNAGYLKRTDSTMQPAYQGSFANLHEDKGNKSFVSIVVCTRNRAEHLERCLLSLASLDYSRYEIIVIDESTSRNQLLINQKIAQSIGARYILVKRKGKNFGQNIGTRAAKGDIIANTDDDCIVDKYWLKFLVENFTDPLVMCAAGRTKSLLSNEISQLFERLASFDRGSRRRVFDRKSISLWSLSPKIFSRILSKQFREMTPAPWGVGYGNNIAYRRTVFDQIGFFDESLGPGTPAAASGDTDLTYRILKAGYKAVYDPRALVFHRHRDNLPSLEQAFYRYGLGQRSLLLKYIRYDPYALFCYVGGVLHLALVILKYRFNGKKLLQHLTIQEFCGWLNLG